MVDSFGKWLLDPDTRALSMSLQKTTKSKNGQRLETRQRRTKVTPANGTSLDTRDLLLFTFYFGQPMNRGLHRCVFGKTPNGRIIRHPAPRPGHLRSPLIPSTRIVSRPGARLVPNGRIIRQMAPRPGHPRYSLHPIDQTRVPSRRASCLQRYILSAFGSSPRTLALSSTPHRPDSCPVQARVLSPMFTPSASGSSSRTPALSSTPHRPDSCPVQARVLSPTVTAPGPGPSSNTPALSYPAPVPGSHAHRTRRQAPRPVQTCVGPHDQGLTL
ncbi:hypothetical protein FB451DRAFT_1183688 [Mycena latifolia]|nr:hypothetical protein FB451DRAFT_1183688 [Mycena latifolia]